MSKFIHIVPIGLEKDRIIYLLQKFPPYRVYFLNYKTETKEGSKYLQLAESIQKEIDSMITLADKKYLTILYDDPENTFLKVLEIMAKEKKQGNFVHSKSHIIACRLHYWIKESPQACRVSPELRKRTRKNGSTCG